MLRTRTNPTVTSLATIASQPELRIERKECRHRVADEYVLRHGAPSLDHGRKNETMGRTLRTPKQKRKEKSGMRVKNTARRPFKH